MAQEFSEDFENNILNLFKKFDKDNSGEISADEVGQLMREVGYNITNEEVHKMVVEIDRDGNEQIDFAEFKVMIQRIMKQNNIEETLKKAFDTFADSKKKLITVQSLKEALNYTGDKLSDEELKEMVEVPEIKNKGGLNFDEFKRILIAK